MARSMIRHPDCASTDPAKASPSTRCPCSWIRGRCWWVARPGTSPIWPTRRKPMAGDQKRFGRGKVVARTGELSHGMKKKFRLKCQGRDVEGLLVASAGSVYAYVNRCRHIPISMDWIDNEFFTEDRRYLICANHGATYEPATGECVWGPWFGGSLQKPPLEVCDGEILADCRQETED